MNTYQKLKEWQVKIYYKILVVMGLAIISTVIGVISFYIQYKMMGW